MKRFLPLLIAGLVFLFALLLMQPEATVPIVAAALDLPAGHVIVEADLQVLALPESQAPVGAFSDPLAVIGERVKIPRTAGDVIFPAHLGGEDILLAPDERAVAIHVTDSGGLAGLLKPGDHVGITAILPDPSGSGTFGKAVIGGLRVLYISPSFTAENPPAEASAQSGESSPFGASSSLNNTERDESGTVVLAVPITARVVGYDFAAYGVPNDARRVYAVDLLPALDQAGNAHLSLYLEPQQAQGFVSSGVYLPDLVRTPGPSPTPTETPEGFELTPTVAITPAPPVVATPAP